MQGLFVVIYTRREIERAIYSEKGWQRRKGEKERDAEGGRWTEVKYSIISSLHNAGVHLAAREWSP